MLHNGFKNVFHLEGGIINYAKQAKEAGLESKFIGKNFVFDDRLGERIGDEIISNCHQCGNPADTHTNCANIYCHILFIQCEECSKIHEGCCSDKCMDFNALPAETQKQQAPGMVFNGSKFGKGAYKAFRKAGGALNG